MDTHIFNMLCEDARSAVTDGRLKDALTAVEGMLTAVNNWEDVQHLQDVRSNYATLLGYLREGTGDPDRENLWLKFIQSVIEVMERTRCTFELQNAEDAWAITARTLKKVYKEDVQRREGLSLKDRFNAIWTSNLWSGECTDWMLAHITLHAATFEERALMVSATMLSCLRFFDKRKLTLLCHLCREQDRNIRFRAQVGLVLCAVSHYSMLRYFPELQSEIVALVEEEETGNELRAIQYYLFSAQNTPHSTRQLEKHCKNLIGWNGHDFSNDKVQRAISIFVDGQERGIDLNYPTFKFLSKLCSDFFCQACNWFYPFSLSHPALDGVAMPPMLKRLFDLNRHTDTDRYALMGMIKKQNVLFKNIESKESEEQLEALALPPEENADNKHYIHDVFRFFTLFPQPDDSHPFQEDLLLCNYPEFSHLFSKAAHMRQLYKVLLDDGCYHDALPLIMKLLKAAPQSEALLQAAADCYMETYNPHRAFTYLSKLQERKPDNFNISLKLAECLVKMHEEAQALPILYKLHFNRPSHTKVLRLLAWCVLRSEAPDTAIDLYAQLTSRKDASSSDFQNYGHALLMQGELAAAVTCYAQFLSMEGQKEDCYKSLFNDDVDWLLEKDVKNDTLRLVADAVADELASR